MKSIVGIVLIIVGVVLYINGYNRKNSVVGAASDFGQKIATTFDGKTRTTEHTTWMIAGGVLVVVGVGVVFLGRRGGKN